MLQATREVLCSRRSLELHLARTQKNLLKSSSTHFAERVGSKRTTQAIVRFVENVTTRGNGIVRFVMFARTAYPYHARGVEAFRTPMRTAKSTGIIEM